MSHRKTEYFSLEPLDARQHFASGFTASYFPTTTFTGTAVTQTATSIAGVQSPPKGISAKAFSARWTGQLNPTTTGRHAVYVSTEGGVRVWINDKLVLNKPAAPGVITHYKMVVALTAGVPATLQIEYRHDSGKPYVGVAYVRPGADKAVLTDPDITARAVSLNDQIDHGRTFAADTLGNTYRSLNPKNGAPSRSDPARPAWQIVPFTDWTSGTFAGSMWELNKTFAGWDKLALNWTSPLSGVKQVGDAFDREWAAFKPFVDASTDADARAFGRQVLLESAARKMNAWNSTVQAFQTPELVSTSGNKKANFGVLMDQTNDMAELLWAGDQLGDSTYRTRVLTHMNTVARTMVRSDGSVVQRGYFYAATGQFIVGENAQGYSNTSTWSRGQAWAMRSFADVAASTGDSTMLAVAKKVADYFISHTPADGVPFWDFQAPGIPHTYRDTSAAAIAASALVRLSNETTGAEQTKYRTAAAKILHSLLGPSYLAEGSKVLGILQHGAAHVPANKGPDASLMFGDYYLLQAMNDYTASG